MEEGTFVDSRLQGSKRGNFYCNAMVLDLSRFFIFVEVLDYMEDMCLTIHILCLDTFWKLYIKVLHLQNVVDTLSKSVNIVVRLRDSLKVLLRKC